MASKTSQSRSAKSGPAGSNALAAEAERLIAREKYKDAVKQAKLCYKEAATPENHRLLERAYFLRARQLVQQGMRSSAFEVVQHLIEFGVTETDSPDELIQLLATLGFEKIAIELKGELGASVPTENIARTVADQLVVHPERPGGASAELVREARLVRQALETLQAGDEPGAMEVLRGLPRSSPLSEWKLFVRGLAAFQRQDGAETRANWDRLDPDRAAARIAGRLERLTADSSGPTGAGLAAAEKIAFGEPVLDRLRQLGLLVAAHEWDPALSLLGSLRLTLHRIDRRLAERLTIVLVGSILKAIQDMDWPRANAVVSRFMRVAEPMAIDPRWNRFQAMVWDGPHADPEGAIRYWLEYLDDLETLEALAPGERTLARALVWKHVGQLRRDAADEMLAELEADDFAAHPRHRAKSAAPPGIPPDVAASRREAISAIERGIELAPDYLPCHRLLVQIHDDWQDHRSMEAAAKRLLDRFPEDVDTLQRLALHHLGARDSRAALPYVLQARRIKPLDEKFRALERAVHSELACALALENRWDEGRAEFAAADALGVKLRLPVVELARRALFEYKAGDRDAGDRYVEQARSTLADPAPLYLALVTQANVFKVPADVIAQFDKQWEAALRKKAQSEAAGLMAAIMTAAIRSKTEYRGREKHVERLVGYLGRTTRLAYRQEDMEEVVEFLHDLLPAHEKLSNSLVRSGVKRHAQSAVLHFFAAEVAMNGLKPRSRKAPAIISEARTHLETALDLAANSTDPRVADYMPDIRRVHAVVTEMWEMMSRFMGGFGFPGLDLDALDIEPAYSLPDDEQFGDELDDDAPFTLDSSPPPPPRNKGGRGKRKK